MQQQSKQEILYRSLEVVLALAGALVLAYLVVCHVAHH